MFTGILIGLGAAFWIYMIFFRENKFDSDAFQACLVCCGIPLFIWILSRIL